MKKFTFLIFCSILLLLLQTELKAQVYQLPNGGFELWDGGTNDEPTYWNGFPSGACDLSGLAALGCSTAKTKRHQKTTDIRPGSSGTYSCKIFATSFGSIIANGNITTGQIRIGSTTPSNSGNYNITRTGDSNFNQAINAKPDSIVFWAKLVCPSATQEARINVVIHDSYDFRDPSTSDASASSHIVGQATCNFARGSQDWIRYSVPFDYNGYTATTPEYILISFTTNVVPGEGSVNDNLFIDDVELVYNVNLQNIFADGTGIENFDPDVTDYYYDADCNYLSNLISAVAVSPNANVDVVQATENNPVAIITVTSGDKSKEYNVHFLNYMSEETYIYEAICETEPYGFFGQELSEENIYRHTLQNIYGCDSVIVLTLTVNPVYETPESAAICEGDTYDFFGTELTEANTYRHTLQSVEGCDSVIVFTLTVNSVDVSVTFYTLEGNALSAVAENAQYQWLDCNNDYSEIEGATDRIFSPVQSGDYAVEITQNDCTDISECQNVIITEIISNEFEN
ncbi:MAG: hypothetical protein LBQ22_00260, partial [Bacteroidales bacterium]|nr:hypothetical protein [Bacteroidales bacterium]